MRIFGSERFAEQKHRSAPKEIISSGSFRQLYINSGSGHVRKEFSYFFTYKNTKAYPYLVLLKNVECLCLYFTPCRSAKVRIPILEAYGTYIIMYGIGTVCYLAHLTYGKKNQKLVK
jgi:hypothetical protein